MAKQAKQAEQRMTAATYRALVEGMRKVRTFGAAPRGANKYHAERVGTHASRREHRRSVTLHTLAAQGIIHDLREQVPFPLIPVQRDENGKLLERGVSYKADFVYRDSDGNLIVEDTKGFRTKEYIIKRKLMLFIHGIRIQEI